MHGESITYNTEQQEFVDLMGNSKPCVLVGAAGTGTLISTLHGCALTSASLASFTGSVAGGTAVITSATAAAGTAAGAAIDKIANK